MPFNVKLPLQYSSNLAFSAPAATGRYLTGTEWVIHVPLPGIVTFQIWRAEIRPSVHTRDRSPGGDSEIAKIFLLFINFAEFKWIRVLLGRLGSFVFIMRAPLISIFLTQVGLNSGPRRVYGCTHKYTGMFLWHVHHFSLGTVVASSNFLAQILKNSTWCFFHNFYCKKILRSPSKRVNTNS